MLDHISIQCADIEASVAFYDSVLGTLGYGRVMDFGGAVGYGREFPAFWVGIQTTGEGFRESHIAFRANSREDVDAFHVAAVALGSEVLHAPRLWPEYHAGYYGVFLRDPDGNNVEAVHHTFG